MDEKLNPAKKFFLIRFFNRHKYTFIFELICIALCTYVIFINTNTNIFQVLIIFILSLIFIFKPAFVIPILFTCSLLTGNKFFVSYNDNGWDVEFAAIFIVCSLLYLIFIKDKFPKIPLRLILFLIAFNTLNFISARYSLTGDLSAAIVMVLNTLVVFFMCLQRDIDAGYIINLMRICLSIFVLYIILFIMFGQPTFSGLRFTLTSRIAHNELGTCLAQIIALFLALLIIDDNILMKIYDLAVSIICLFLLFITGCRSGLIGVAGAFAFTLPVFIIVRLIVLIVKKDIKRLVIWGLALILVASGIYAAYLNRDIIFEKYIDIEYIQNYLDSNFFEKYLDIAFFDRYFNSDFIKRFFIENMIESGASGRVEIWNALIDHVIPENLMFGVGFGGINVTFALMPYISSLHQAHNFVLSIITQTGIVGSVLYFGFFLYFEIRSLIALVKNKYIVVPIMLTLTAFINGMGEDIIVEGFLWVAIGLGFMIIWQLKSDVSSEKSVVKERSRKIRWKKKSIGIKEKI